MSWGYAVALVDGYTARGIKDTCAEVKDGLYTAWRVRPRRAAYEILGGSHPSAVEHQLPQHLVVFLAQLGTMLELEGSQ